MSSSSNPFAQFAAGASASSSSANKTAAAAAAAAAAAKKKKAAPSASSGWLTTKKRGRDDALIEKDKKKALAARTQRRQQPKLKAGAEAKAKAKAKAKGGNKKTKVAVNRRNRRRHRSDLSESEESFQGYDESSEDEAMDDFIVDDDEDISEEESSGSSEGEEEVTFMVGNGNKGKRTSVAPSRLRGAGQIQATSSRRVGGGGGRAKRKAVNDDGSDSDSDSESVSPSMSSATEDEINSPPHRRPQPPARRAAARRAAGRLLAEEKKDDDHGDGNGSTSSSSGDDYGKTMEVDSNTDDDTDDELEILPSKKKHKASAVSALPTTSKYFQIPKKGETKKKRTSTSNGGTANTTMSLSSDEDESDEEVGPPLAAGNGSRRGSAASDGGSLGRAGAGGGGGGPSSSSVRRDVFGSSDGSDGMSDRKQKTTSRARLGIGSTMKSSGRFDSDSDDESGDEDGQHKFNSKKPFFGGNRSKKSNGKKFYKNRNKESDKNSSAWVSAVADAGHGFDGDDFMDSDDDEALALGLALSASMKENVKNGSGGKGRKKLGGAKKAAAGKKNKKKKKRKKPSRVTADLSPVSTESGPIEIGSDDEEDGGMEQILAEESESDDGQEVDEYEDVDEAEREAGLVLKVANELSADVLRTMSTWSPNHSANADGQEVIIPKGMIVDGALAMSTLLLPDASDGHGASKAAVAASAGDNSLQAQHQAPTHEWISQDEMEKVCPGLKLAKYQLIGVNWLALLHSMKCDVGVTDKKKKEGKDDGRMNVNGVLADEMGLGKTVQTIAFLAWLKHHNASSSKEAEETTEGSSDNDIEVIGDSSDDDDDDGSNATARKTSKSSARPHIIIVPASVLSNWEREFEKFCPSMNVIKYHGSMQEREDLRRVMKATYLPKQGRKSKEKLDVVLTTFSYFSKEVSDDRTFLRKFHFDYMVVDEAHQLKNPRGMRYKNMDKFSTSHRLLLTGTPIQNSPKELMALLCFLMPLFSKRASAFEDAENDGGARMLEYFVSLQGETNSSANAYSKLKHLLAPFCLRRRKDDCLSQIMPKKTREKVSVPFDEIGRRVYDSIIEGHIKAKQKGEVVDDAATQNHLFTSLRKAANHPLLLRTRHTSEDAIEHLVHHTHMYGYWGSVATDTDKKELIRRELSKFSDFDIHGMACELIDENPRRAEEMDRYKLTENDLFCSPKFVRLRTLIPELIKGSHRMLIFSQWTRCLDLLGCLLESMGLEFLRIDGSTKVSERQDLMDKFNGSSNIPVFLLSTRAGGMGINLTGADTCILHDLDFNPFNDLQAEDRCHRIGQTKPVTVFKMVTENTVDSDIYDMQKQKAEMNKAIIGGDDLGQGSSKAQKKEEAEAVNNIVQSAVSRYFASPKDNKKKSTSIVEQTKAGGDATSKLEDGFL